MPVERTSAEVFGRPFIPISALGRWAAEHDAPVLVIGNGDIELTLTPVEPQRLRHLADGGLCYLVRHNHGGDRRRAAREPWGIDAFLFHGRDAGRSPTRS